MSFTLRFHLANKVAKPEFFKFAMQRNNPNVGRVFYSFDGSRFVIGSDLNHPYPLIFFKIFNSQLANFT